MCFTVAGSGRRGRGRRAVFQSQARGTDHQRRPRGQRWREQRSHADKSPVSGVHDQDRRVRRSGTDQGGSERTETRTRHGRVRL